MYISFSNLGKVKKKNKLVLWGKPLFGFNGWNQNRIIIEWSKFSVIIDVIFIHAWETLYLLIRKMCVFFSFWRHIQYLFQWKGENTDKKINIFVAPTQWIFSLVLMPSWKWKSKQNRQIILKKTNQSSPQVTKYPLFLRGYQYTPNHIFLLINTQLHP